MRRKALFAGAALVPLAAVCLAAYSCRPRIGPDWTPQRFQAELARAGHPYDGEWYLGGLLLKRRGDPTPWPKVEELMNGHVGRLARRRGVLHVMTFGGRRSLAAEQTPGIMALDPLTIRGHPDDLRIIADLFAP